MIKIYQLKTMKREDKKRILQRYQQDMSQVKKQVAPIIEEIKNRGDQAIIEYIKKFDCLNLKTDQFRISAKEIKKAYQEINPLTLKMMRKQIRLSKKFAQEQYNRLEKQWKIESLPGVKVGQKITPINSVGLYVPGGTASYPTVMQILAVPAKIAGVKRIVAMTPPRKENYEVIVAANEAGVDEIYRIGGVAAIASLAYGTKTIKPVSKIIGPGNIYVTASKLLVFGEVAIDMPAGPSEVIILADEKANPSYCAADLLAQLEHDPNAAGVLITWSNSLAKKAVKEIFQQLPKLSRQKIIIQSLKHYSAIIVVSNIKEALDFINEYAPEHLELLVEKPNKLLSKIKNASSIFLGENTPVPVADYASGTNHTLPTGAGAKMFSPVSVETFMKKSEFQSLTKTGLRKLAPIIRTISKVEGLDAHWQAVKRRLEKKG